MKPANILIIDDERIICEGCRLALLPAGHTVEYRTDGSGGLAALRERRFDIVLLDMKLPDTDGMEILDALRHEQPDTYVIIMTGYFTVQNAVEAMKKGAVDYLTKPFTDDALNLSVERALEKKRLIEENRHLRKALYDRYRFDQIVGDSPAIREVFEKIRRVASEETTVLLCGESGTGKELFARAIHAHSPRAARHFVAVDCSTLSPSLLESELFGHVKGAFTGATDNRDGVFEAAHEGTLFLDDIANLNMEIQSKLLRVLETREYKPVGSSRAKTTDIRVIAATNQDLKTMVEENTFREDLFYRLSVFPVFLPPLRDRKEDIPRLCYHFLRLFCKKTGKTIDGFSDDAMDTLANHPWPGNVRQLKNTVERMVILADTPTLDSLDLLEARHGGHLAKPDIVPKTIDELKQYKEKVLQNNYRDMEKAFLANALKQSDGNISRAAEIVGMQRSNFSSLMKKHGLRNSAQGV